jgi:hypothetical protein
MNLDIKMIKISLPNSNSTVFTFSCTLIKTFSIEKYCTVLYCTFAQ